VTALVLPLDFAPPDDRAGSSLTLCACGRYARNAAGKWCHRIYLKGAWRLHPVGKNPKPCAGCGQDLTMEGGAGSS